MLVSTFALLDDDICETLIEKREEFTQEFHALISGEIEAFIPWISNNYSDKNFEYAISQSTGKKTTIFFRFDNFIELINRYTPRYVNLEGTSINGNH